MSAPNPANRNKAGNHVWYVLLPPTPTFLASNQNYICYARVTVFLFPICRINTASMGSRVFVQGTPTVAHPERGDTMGAPEEH